MNGITNQEKLEYKIKRRKGLLEAVIRARVGERTNEILEGKEVKEIEIKKSFNNFIKDFERRKEFQKLDERQKQEVYEKLFMILNRAGDLESNKKPSTANISSFFALGVGIETIIRVSKEEIKELFSFLDKNGIPFSSITGMQAGKGLPNLAELEKFLQFLKDKKVELNSITCMQHGRGLPNLAKLATFIKISREKGVDIRTVTGKQLGLEKSLELVKNM